MTGKLRLIAACALCLLSACAAYEAPLRPVNPMGLSGRVAPEAEKNYALARVLWGNSDVCSDPAQAVAYLDKAIAAQPDYAAAYLRRGLAYSEMGRYEEAFDDLTRSLRLHPGAEVYSYRGLVSMRMGNMMGARKDLDHAIELDGGYHRAWNFRAAVRLQQDDVAGACDDFAKGCSKGDCTGIESARTSGICK